MRNTVAFAVALACGALLSGCGGSSGSAPPQPQSHKVGGNVTGLAGTGLVLAINGTDNLTITGNGTFVFPSTLADNQTYSITVATQPTVASPSLPQTCFVSSGTGTVQGADVQNVAVSCVNNAARYAYVANGGSNEISGYAINNQTGVLSSISGSPFPAGADPEALTIHPSGKFAYASNAGDDTISEYTIDSRTGALAAISGSPLPVPPTTTPLTGFSILPVVIDPSGKLAFVGNPTVSWPQSGPPQPDNLDVYSIDATSGGLTEIPGSPLSTGSDLPEIVAVNPSDTFVYIVNGDWQIGADQCSISVFRINLAMASVTAVAGSPFYLPPNCRMDSATSFLLGSSGMVGYFTADGSADLIQWLTLDSATGAVTAGSGEPSESTSPTAAPAVDPSGKFLYLANPGSSPGQQYVVYEFSVDSTTGALTAIGNVPTGSANPVVIDPAGKFLYVATTTAVYAYTIDSSTGALTAVSGSPFTIANSSDSIAGLIAIDPSGRFAYLPSAGSSLIYAMAIDPTTGALTPVPGSPFPSGASPGKISFLY